MARLSEDGVVSIVVSQDVLDVSSIFPTRANFPAFHDLANTIFRMLKSPYWSNLQLVEDFKLWIGSLWLVLPVQG